MKPKDHFSIIYSGSYRNVCEIMKNGKSTIRDFIEELETADRNSLLRLMEELGNRDIRNTEKFRHEGDGIFAIKSGQIRIFCFIDSGSMILTHGIKKKQSRTRRGDHEKSVILRDYYFEQGGLNHGK